MDEYESQIIQLKQTISLLEREQARAERHRNRAVDQIAECTVRRNNPFPLDSSYLQTELDASHSSHAKSLRQTEQFLLTWLSSSSLPRGLHHAMSTHLSTVQRRLSKLTAQ